jgi:hypothetical protein
MVDRSTGTALEEHCQRPGLWYIEGFQVLMRSHRGKRAWWVYRATEDGGKELLDRIPSLDAARDRIRQEIEGNRT